MNLRVSAIFIIMIISLLGVFIPIIWGSNYSILELKTHPGFTTLRTFSAGIMTGVAFIHLLADAAFSLEVVCPEYPSLAFSLCCSSLFLLIFLENIMSYIMKPVSKLENIEGCESPECQGEHQLRAPFQPLNHTSTKNHGKHHVDSNCEHSNAINFVADSSGLLALIKAYIMEISIAIHSVIIGISLGSMDETELPTIKVLIIAIAFHQFFEGASLGTVISFVRNKLGACKSLSFAVLFSITTPIGIMIGILLSLHQKDETEAHIFTTACANALAAGALIYIALVEIVAVEFASPMLETKPLLKFSMIASFGIGNLIMAILAIWA